MGERERFGEERNATVGIALWGARVLHVVSWPHGDHVFLGDEESGRPLLRLQAYGVAESSREVPAGANAARLTEQEAGGRRRFRLYVLDPGAGPYEVAEAPAWDAVCDSVTAFPISEREFWGFMLSPAHEALVRRTTEAVVSRDVAAVAPLLRAGSEAGDFWMWTDEPPEWRELALPPGKFADWEVSGFSFVDDPTCLYVHVAMWCRTGPTDLTLRFYIHDADSAAPRVELEDLHVM